MRSLFASMSMLASPNLIPRLKSSCMALLGRTEITPDARNIQTEGIRALMLGELGEQGAKKYPAVARRLQYAPDVQGLWYARSDMMAILANTYGETIARTKIAHISGQFNGLLPKSLIGKSGPRGR